MCRDNWTFAFWKNRSIATGTERQETVGRNDSTLWWALCTRVRWCCEHETALCVSVPSAFHLTFLRFLDKDYKEYANAHYSGLWTAPAIALISSAMVRAYCHKVIKLSNTLQSYAVEKESTSNVHGVRANFWQEGVRRSKLKNSWADAADKSADVYFIGKLLWTKGLDLMLDLEDYYKQYTGEYFPIDIYGSGPDQVAIARAFRGRRNFVSSKKDNATDYAEASNATWNDPVNQTNGESSESSAGQTSRPVVTAMDKIAQLKESISAVDIQEKTREHLAKIKESINAVDLPLTFAELVRRQPIPAAFPGRVDHGTLTGRYKIFVNPSISEVLCTTTAEALAMGKFAIVPVHPSNTFFLQFPNCLAYRNKFEFVANLRWALTHDPEPLTAEQARQFTWEAATERLLAASAITWREALMRERLGLAKLDERIAWFHNELGKGPSGDFIRRVLGAGPASHQVKYQKDKEAGDIAVPSNGDTDETANDSSDLDEEDESGFSSKFRLSSFASAIRATLGDFSAFGIQ
jgi:glycosyltransferase involved in cell wall biosynthesis